MNEIDNEKLAKLVIDAMSKRGGKPTKYTGYDKYPEIIELINRDVQLPYILKWLTEKNGEKLVLNTLRKYVVFKIGRVAYEEYLKRNGWLKPRKTLPGRGSTGSCAPTTNGADGAETGSGVGQDEAQIDYNALAANLKTETTPNGFMRMPGEPDIKTGSAGMKQRN